MIYFLTPSRFDIEVQLLNSLLGNKGRRGTELFSVSTTKAIVKSATKYFIST